MAIAAPWVGTAVPGNAAGGTTVTATASCSGATDGEVVFACLGLGAAALMSAITESTGTWTQLTKVTEGSTTSQTHAIFWKVKDAGTTGVTFNWTGTSNSELVCVSWPGVHNTTPTEAKTDLLHASGTAYTTTASTATVADRWAVAVFTGTGSTAAIAFSAPLMTGVTPVARSNVLTTAARFEALLVVDSNATVSAASHSWSATGQSTSHGYGTQFYLIPAPAASAASARPVMLRPGVAVHQASGW